MYLCWPVRSLYTQLRVPREAKRNIAPLVDVVAGAWQRAVTGAGGNIALQSSQWRRGWSRLVPIASAEL